MVCPVRFGDSGMGEPLSCGVEGSSVFSDWVLARRRGFMAGIGGIGFWLGCGPFGSPINGTEEVLDMKVGSEIIPFTIDFFRIPGVGRPSTGVTRPAVGGCGIGPTGDGRADVMADGELASPGDVPG